MQDLQFCSILENLCPFNYEFCIDCHVYKVVEEARRKAHEFEKELEKRKAVKRN